MAESASAVANVGELALGGVAPRGGRRRCPWSWTLAIGASRSLGRQSPPT